MNIDKLKTDRKVAKGNITRIENWELKFPLITDPCQVNVKLDNLKKAYAAYCDIQDTLDGLLPNEIDNDQRDCMDERYGQIMSRLENRMKPIVPATQSNPVASQTQIANSTPPIVKLPEIKIQIFSGKPTEWNPFIELFTALILENTSLLNVQKFIYLKSFLKDEPLKLIENIQITNDNFHTALDILKNRYENKTLLVNTLLSSILDMKIVQKGTASQLREFHTNITKNWEAIKNLNLTSDQILDLVLVFTLEKKLDYPTKRHFEFERDLDTLPTFDEFLETIDDRCKGLESLQALEPNSGKNVAKASLHTGVNSNTTQAAATTGNSCLYCNSAHKIYNCLKFKNLRHSEKVNFIKSAKLCFNCLGSRHLISECKARSCTTCNRKHHTLLHIYPTSNENSSPLSRSSSAQGTPTSNFNFNRSQDSLSDEKPHSYRRKDEPSTLPPQRFPTPTGAIPRTPLPTSNSRQQENTAHALSVTNIQNIHVLLGTAQVYVYSSQGVRVQAKAVLDPGSQHSFITQHLVEKLQYPTYNRNLSISGIGANITESHRMVTIVAHSTVNRSRFKLVCSVLEKLTCKLPQIKIDNSQLRIPSGVSLADTSFFEPSDIDLLIGADRYYDVLTEGVIHLGNHLPTLLATQLGWVVAGNVPVSSNKAKGSSLQGATHFSESIDSIGFSNSIVAMCSQAICQPSLESLVENLWKLDQVSQDSPLTPEEELSENIFTSTTLQLPDKSYQVDLPMKTPREYIKLGDSLTVAKRRFYNLEKKFEKNPSFFLEYKKFIDEYVQLGHGKYVPLVEINEYSELKYFLPHHAVIREDSITTKLRVVFDASCKTTTGISLNDVMLKGRQVQPNIFDILLRFRSFKFVLTSDIQKMYRCIKVNPKHTFLLNILWRDNPSLPLKCIELITVTYGTNSAPFLATRILNKIAFDGKEEFPLAARNLLNQTYVDDILGGCDNIQELSQLYEELRGLLTPAHLNLHKWNSNSLEFLQSHSLGTFDDVDFNSVETLSKVLGLKWSPSHDNLGIAIPQISLEGPITKRRVLSIVAQCWDPLGFLAPVIVVGKLMIQKLWSLKVDWDTEIIETSLTNNWNKFISQLVLLKDLKIPRYVFYPKSIVRIEFHGFSDASTLAYAACVYLRTQYSDDSVSCCLIASKSRVAPLKAISIPRLELSAMLILAQLISSLITIFKERFTPHSTHLHSDSEVALCWASTHPSCWDAFVANRVTKIQELTSGFCWHHVRSGINPADLPSRGLSPSELMKSELWWKGPKFLLNSNLTLTSFSNKRLQLNEFPEARRAVLHSLPLPKPEDFWDSLFSKFSRFLSLQRTVAYCFRFIYNSSAKSRNLLKYHGPISVLELSRALLAILKTLQVQHFEKELNEVKSNEPLSNRNLRQLKAFIDPNDGLLRVGGRLHYADISYNSKHPILLPSRNKIVSLMLKQEHIRLGHSGAQTTLSNFRQRYWPLNGLRQIKKIIHNCSTCYRFNPKDIIQEMASLPKERVTISKPFSKVGVDYGGPFLIKSSHLRKAPIIKAYLAIFVCMVTKAVHLELVTSLSTDAFLMTLKRFISRRGNPTTIFCDNGTNFWGARNQLKELHQFLTTGNTNRSIQDFCSNNFIQFNFIPPNSPHWGGLWEAAVKSTKCHLVKLVGNSSFTFEVFYTILTQIEAILNSRPLCPLSSDPNDLEVLTPGHFLIGSSLTACPEENVLHISENRLSLWQKVSQVQQTFWRRWSLEYLNRLQNRPKWFQSSIDLKVGDLVLLKEDHSPPLHWPLARVTEIYPGKDKKIRVVKLKTKEGEYTRPIVKVCPLPYVGQEPNEQ